MNTNLIIWVLVIVAIILFVQYVLAYRKANKLKKTLENRNEEARHQADSLRKLTAEHNELLRLTKAPDLNDLEFTFKDGVDIGDRTVKLKRTPDGIKFYTRAKKAGKFTDVEVYPKYG